MLGTYVKQKQRRLNYYNIVFMAKTHIFILVTWLISEYEKVKEKKNHPLTNNQFEYVIPIFLLEILNFQSV